MDEVRKVPSSIPPPAPRAPLALSMLSSSHDVSRRAWQPSSDSPFAALRTSKSASAAAAAPSSSLARLQIADLPLHAGTAQVNQPSAINHQPLSPLTTSVPRCLCGSKPPGYPFSAPNVNVLPAIDSYDQKSAINRQLLNDSGDFLAPIFLPKIRAHRRLRISVSPWFKFPRHGKFCP
jgi:hypothetical protein